MHLIGTDILRPHHASFGVCTFDFVRLTVDRCSECVENRESITSQHDVAALVASVLFDTTLFQHAASREPVHLSPTFSATQLLSWRQCPAVSLPRCAPFFVATSTIGAARVLSVANASNKSVGMCAGSPIAVVSFVTPPQLSTFAFRIQACDSCRYARRLRRPRG